MPTTPSNLLSALSPHRLPLTNGWAKLLPRLANAHIVCIGEASHGTEEFYRIRAELSQTLIEHHGFSAVAVEADWPDAYRVNRFVNNLPAVEGNRDPSPEAALDGFKRFPAWMWRNHAVKDFIDWLKSHNLRRPRSHPRAGFYGIDLYALHRSIHAVISYLRKTDPALAAKAIDRYRCFEEFEHDPHLYGHATASGAADPCEHGAVQQLTDLQRNAADLSRRHDHILPDEYFYAVQNARLVKNAEQYYRSMYRGRANSWNLRDTHMADTVDALLTHLRHRDGHARLIVWAHNSHLGDARATDTAKAGELNLGQLLRERHPNQTFHLGFTTYQGSVLAANNWDEPPHVKTLRPALNNSYESLFHHLGGDFWLPLWFGAPAREHLLAEKPKLERAVGVIYRPGTERQSHYFYAHLPEQFDAVIHIDQTRALTPLDPPTRMPGIELPETFPSAV